MNITREEYVICLHNNTPVKSYTPRNSPAVKQAIETELEKLERADFIELSISPYSAPTVCIRKPDGSLRVTIDFRMVNKNVINDAYPMHRVKDQLEAMSGALVFSTLDLTKRYHQMKLADESNEITAFTSPKGLLLMEGVANGNEDFWGGFSKVNGLDAWESTAKMCCGLYR